MKGSYRFFYRDNKLVCSVRDEDGSNIYTGERAYSLFRRINKEKISSIKVNQNRNDNLYFVLKGEDCTITLKDLDKLYYSNLLEELGVHEKKFEKAIDKFEKKKKRNKNTKVRNLVLGAVIASLVTTGSIGFSLNRDKSEEISGNDINIENVDEDKNVDEIVQEINNDLKKMELEVDEDRQIEYLFEDKTNTDTYKYVNDNYGELIENIASKRGISPNLLKAMVTQESAGSDPNLMQIQFWSFADMEVSAYNYETGESEKICLTDDPSRHSDCRCISRDELLIPEVNVDVGAIILQYDEKMFDGNVPLTVLAYNLGPGNVEYVIDVMSKNTGMSREDIINDKNSIEFTKYTDCMSVGDPSYIDHVMRYVGTDSDEIYIKSHSDGKESINTFSLLDNSIEKSKNL